MVFLPGSAIKERAELVSTEVSQIPLSGVKAILKCARESGVLGILDLDMTPTVCVEEAELGSFEELLECIKLCDVLKPAKEALMEVLIKCDPTISPSLSLEEASTKCRELFGCQLIAVTDGGHPSVLSTPQHVTSVSPPAVREIVDTTGAGDAFLGGLIAGVISRGIPSTEADLRWLGSLANGFGATCVQYVGGVPGKGARDTLMSYVKDLYELPSLSTAPSPDYKASMTADMEAIKTAIEALNDSNVKAFFDVITSCKGQILTSGVGKSGVVASRLSGSLSSIGIASQYVHSTEWVHGDLGKVRPGKDVVIFFSHSGNTAETVSAAKHLADSGTCTLAVTSNADSELSTLTTERFIYGFEALTEPFGVLPTHSLVIQEAVSNAIVYECIKQKRILKEVFKKHHPGGSIGLKLSSE
jgi:arabinose-5-phosphate isomerase